MTVQHDLQLRAAVHAHYAYAHPFGPMRFEDAEAKRTPDYLRAVETAREESAEIDDLLNRDRQMELL